jgi:hypothetical protein
MGGQWPAYAIDSAREGDDGAKNPNTKSLGLGFGLDC